MKIRTLASLIGMVVGGAAAATALSLCLMWAAFALLGVHPVIHADDVLIGRAMFLAYLLGCALIAVVTIGYVLAERQIRQFRNHGRFDPTSL